MKTHELKTDPEPFDAVWRLKKRFEIRSDDRGFKVGDLLLLQETKYSAAEMSQGMPLEYTGESVRMLVRYILRGPAYGVPEGFVIMS